MTNEANVTDLTMNDVEHILGVQSELDTTGAIQEITVHAAQK